MNIIIFLLVFTATTCTQTQCKFYGNKYNVTSRLFTNMWVILTECRTTAKPDMCHTDICHTESKSPQEDR